MDWKIEWPSASVMLLALLGMGIHMMARVLARADGPDKKFSWGHFLRDSGNHIRVMISLFSGFALILMMDGLASLVSLDLDEQPNLRAVFAFVFGYLNYSLIHYVIKIFTFRFGKAASGSGEATEDDDTKPDTDSEQGV